MVNEDTRAQLRGYIRHNAGKPLPTIVERVREQLDELRALVEGMSDGQAAFRPSPEEWSAREVAGHIAMYSPSVRELVLDLDAGRPGTYYRNNGAPPERPVGDLAISEGLAVAHRELDSLAAVFKGREPDTGATFAHPWFGELNAKEWLFFLRLHAYDHMGQIRKNIQHPDYPK